MKIAVLSHAMPPSWSGQAMMLGRLLQDLSPDDYCLISDEKRPARSSSDSYGAELRGRFYVLPPERGLRRGHRFGLKYARALFNAVPGVVGRGRRVAEIVRREKCEAIVACTGVLYDLPAGYLASRLTGVPFYPYLFDYYAYQFLTPEHRLVARLLEPTLMKGAARVIAPNEVLRDEMRSRYGVEALIIRNPCDLSQYESLPRAAAARPDGETRITYTGAIYEAHFDAFRNLIAAIRMLGDEGVKIHLYTAQDPSQLAAEGISGPVVFHEHQPVEAMPGIQRRADVLFLPLAFESPYPELVRTSATSKLAEYLAARRPVLVHAPPDSFVSWYFHEHQCGLVVDRPDPSLLAQALRQIRSDAGLRERLGEASWRRAVSDFSVDKARADFYGLLRLDGGGPASAGAASRRRRRREQAGEASLP